MSWRRFHLILFMIVLAVAIIRLLTGNILGAIVPIILAMIFGSIAADYPLLARLKQLWIFFRRILKKRS